MLDEGYEQNVMGMSPTHFTFPQTLLFFVVYNLATQSRANNPAASLTPWSLPEMQNSPVPLHT